MSRLWYFDKHNWNNNIFIRSFFSIIYYREKKAVRLYARPVSRISSVPQSRINIYRMALYYELSLNLINFFLLSLFLDKLYEN